MMDNATHEPLDALSLVAVQHIREKKRTQSKLITLDKCTISKRSIRCLIRQAGIARVDTTAYAVVENVVTGWLHEVLKHALIYMHHGRRVKLQRADVDSALKHMGQTIYGISRP